MFNNSRRGAHRAGEERGKNNGQDSQGVDFRETSHERWDRARQSIHREIPARRTRGVRHWGIQLSSLVLFGIEQARPLAARNIYMMMGPNQQASARAAVAEEELLGGKRARLTV